MADVAAGWQAIAPPSRGASGRPVVSAARRPRISASALGGFALSFGIWLSTRTYTGLRHDGRIYIGRAVADLSPGTVGRDMMFRYDGQAGFSLYTPLVRWLVGAVGPAAAGAGLTFVAMLLWFAAAAALVTRLASGRLRWAMLICLALLPNGYGGFTVMSYGEAFAAPRPFAEAATLAALAALLDARRLVALCLLALAAVFHPIMALAGFGVAFLVLAMEDRRWWALAPLGAVAALAAFAMHAPLVGRLTEAADPAWLATIRWRNPYLFPSQWPLSTWSQSAVQLTTVALAALLLDGRRRRVFVAVLIVASAGLAVSFLLQDVFPDVLVMQVQPWRTLWLAAVLGAAGTAICGAGLRTAVPAARLALPLLALAWMIPGSPVAIGAAAMAAGLYALSRTRHAAAVGAPAVLIAWALVGVVALAWLATAGLAAARFVTQLPPGSENADLIPLAFGLAALGAPLAIWAARPLPQAVERRLPAAMLVLGVVVLGWSVLRWDRAPTPVRPGPGGDAVMERLLARRPGPIVWIGGDDTQPWMLANRAAWVNDLQGASIVFNRDLALLWAGRMRLVIDLGLAPKSLLHPFDDDESAAPLRPSAEGLRALCRIPEGPAWIVAPLIDGEPAPTISGLEIWRLPKPAFLREGRYTWRRVSRYALVDCARSEPLRPPFAARLPGPPDKA